MFSHARRAIYILILALESFLGPEFKDSFTLRYLDMELGIFAPCITNLSIDQNRSIRGL